MPFATLDNIHGLIQDAMRRVKVSIPGSKKTSSHPETQPPWVPGEIKSKAVEAVNRKQLWDITGGIIQ